MSLTVAELRAQWQVDESELDRSVGGIGSKVAAVAGAIGAAGILGQGLADSLDAENLSARTAAALALTEPQAARAGEVSGRLYAGAYSDSMEGANLGVEAVMSSIAGMRDASTADLQKVSEAALTLSNVMGIDVGRGAQVAGQMITNGLAADGTEAFDLLMAASQQVPASIRDDLIDATDEYGQYFASLGYSGREAMALLVDASAQGMYGIDKTGDAIKELTIRATDMSTSSTAAYSAIGLDAETMANRMLAGGQTARQATNEIVNGLLGMSDPAAQAQAAIALFGTPLEDLNTSEIPAFLSQLTMASGELENVAGSSQRAGDALGDTASGKLTAFKQAAQQALVDFLGGEVIPKIEDLTTWVTDNGDEIKKWAEIIGTVLLPILAAWGTAALINAAKNVAAWVMASVAAAGGSATQSLSAGQVVLSWVIMGAQSLANAARMAAAWFIALGPIGWVIAAVIGLVILIVANWDWVVEKTTAAWGWVSGKVSEAWQWIKDKTGEAVSWVGSKIEWFSGLPGRIATWFGGVKDSAVQKLQELISWVAGLPGSILSALGSFGSLLLNAGRDLLSGLWNGIQAAKSWLLGKVGDFFGSILPGWVKDMLGIRSPSTVFAEFGHYLMLGLAKGIDGSTSEAAAAAARAAAAVTLAGSTATITPAGLAALGNRQAAGLTPTAAGGPLFSVDTINLMEGDAADVASQLAFDIASRGGV